MPTEQEMLPKDKYTIFDRKEKKYRKAIHSKHYRTKMEAESAILTLCRAPKVDPTFPAPQPTRILDELRHQRDVYEYCIGNAWAIGIKSSMDGVYGLRFVQLRYTEAFDPDAEQINGSISKTLPLGPAMRLPNACDASCATAFPSSRDP